MFPSVFDHKRTENKMIKIQYILFILALSYINLVQSLGLCNYEDTVCTTLASRRIYRYVLSGIEGLFEPSDPLYLPEVKSEIPNLKYELSNATLTGMKNCEIVHLILRSEEESFEYQLGCPHLLLTQNYNRKSNSDPLEINQNGFVTFSLKDYEIVVKGKFGEEVTEEDSKPHFFIKSYYSTFKAKGIFTIHINGPLYNNKTKPDSTTVTKKLKEMEKELCIPTMEKYMEIILKKNDLYLRRYPTDEILPADYSNLSLIQTPVKV